MVIIIIYRSVNAAITAESSPPENKIPTLAPLVLEGLGSTSLLLTASSKSPSNLLTLATFSSDSTCGDVVFNGPNGTERDWLAISTLILVVNDDICSNAFGIKNSPVSVKH